MGKEITKKAEEFSVDSKKIAKVEDFVIRCKEKLVNLKICELKTPLGSLDVFSSKEKAFSVSEVSAFCGQYEKFFPRENSFFFLIYEEREYYLLEVYKIREVKEGFEYEGCYLNSNRILPEGTRVVLAA